MPKVVSSADPSGRWTGADGGSAYFAYATNYLVDLDHAIIVDVEPTTAIRQAEVTAAKRMIERSRERFGLWPVKLAADTGYGPAAMLEWLAGVHLVMAAGVTDELWEVADIVALVEAAYAPATRRGTYEKQTGDAAELE